jgi:hypothetical protein
MTTDQGGISILLGAVINGQAEMFTIPISRQRANEIADLMDDVKRARRHQMLAEMISKDQDALHEVLTSFPVKTEEEYKEDHEKDFFPLLWHLVSITSPHRLPKWEDISEERQALFKKAWKLIDDDWIPLAISAMMVVLCDIWNSQHAKSEPVPE